MGQSSESSEVNIDRVFESIKVECIVDPIFFAEQYFVYQELLPAQKEWMVDHNIKIHLGFVRRSGRTTLMLARALWQASFFADQTIMYVSPMRGHQVDAMDRLNEEVRANHEIFPAVVRIHNSEIAFGNGSRILVASPTRSSFRGQTIDTCLLDCSGSIDPQYKEELYPTMTCYATVIEAN